MPQWFRRPCANGKLYLAFLLCECDVVKDTGKEEYLRLFIHIGLDWIGIMLKPRMINETSTFDRRTLAQDTFIVNVRGFYRRGFQQVLINSETTVVSNQRVNVAMAILYTFIQLRTTTPFTLNAFSVMTTHCAYR